MHESNDDDPVAAQSAGMSLQASPPCRYALMIFACFRGLAVVWAHGFSGAGAMLGVFGRVQNGLQRFFFVLFIYCPRYFHMLNSLIWLLGYQLAGEILSRSLSLPIPGAVIGMLLLFLTFCMRRSIPDHMKQTAPALLSQLSMLFIPAGVGLIVWRKMLETYALSLLLVIIVATLVTWLVSAGSLHWLQLRHAKRGGR